MTYRKLTNEELQRIHELRQRYYSYRDLEKTFKVSHATIYRNYKEWLKKRKPWWKELLWYIFISVIVVILAVLAIKTIGLG